MGAVFPDAMKVGVRRRRGVERLRDVTEAKSDKRRFQDEWSELLLQLLGQAPLSSGPAPLIGVFLSEITGGGNANAVFNDVAASCVEAERRR